MEVSKDCELSLLYGEGVGIVDCGGGGWGAEFWWIAVVDLGGSGVWNCGEF